MAIPFLFPSQQDENDYLIEQLYRIVRQILLRQGRRVDPPPVPAPRNRTNQQRRPMAEESEPQNLEAMDQIVHRDLPLPDVVLSTGFNAPLQGSATQDIPVPPPRRFVPAAATEERPQPPPRRPRRRRVTKKLKQGAVSFENDQNDTWQQMGKELGKIADDFKASNLQRQEDTNTTSNVELKKEVNWLSLLVPAPFNGSLWTAVIFLVGWRLLTGRGW